MIAMVRAKIVTTVFGVSAEQLPETRGLFREPASNPGTPRLMQPMGADEGQRAD